MKWVHTVALILIRQILIVLLRVPFDSRITTPVRCHVFLHATTFWLVPGISSGSRGVLLNCGKNQLLLRCAVPE